MARIDPKPANGYTMIARTFEGLEDFLAAELEKLGAQTIVKQKRAVQFSGDDAVLYRVNYASRFATRVLKPIFQFKAANGKELYEQARELDWGKVFNLHHTFAIDTLVFHAEAFQNTMYASLKLKDAIADHFRDKYGARPNVEKDRADIRFHLNIHGEKCVVSLDSSGESLHKRGYRRQDYPGSLNEVVAAALIEISGWNGEMHFVDPMCGSGTLLIEAAMKMLGIPAGYFRKDYSFYNWKDFKPALWAEVRNEFVFQQMRPLIKIKGGDLSDLALERAAENIREAGLQRYISLDDAGIDEFRPPRGKGILIINPPYGERFQEDELKEVFQEIARELPSRFKHYTAWIISPDESAPEAIGLIPAEKFKIFNGVTECRLLKFDCDQLS